MRNHQMPDYWCLSDRSLDELFALFRTQFPCEEFDHDAENVWAWIEGITSDQQLGFNITRRHHMGEPLPVEPVAFRFTTYSANADTKQLGSLLAKSLHTNVYVGEITYVSGDQFSYRQVECFTP